jgi:hypothetical protein
VGVKNEKRIKIYNMSRKHNKIVIIHDTIQHGYRYELSEPAGKNFRADFTPDLPPKEMLALGVFGGKYMTDCTNEFPKDWFAHAKLCHEKHDPTLNYFGVNASKSLAYWRTKGWIHPDDPRGWFQWYCRYYMGRRHPDDDRQIKRWKAFRRHAGAVVANCRQGDMTCRRRQRQALLHWAYDSRKI